MCVRSLLDILISDQDCFLLLLLFYLFPSAVNEGSFSSHRFQIFVLIRPGTALPPAHHQFLQLVLVGYSKKAACIEKMGPTAQRQQRMQTRGFLERVEAVTACCKSNMEL